MKNSIEMPSCLRAGRHLRLARMLATLMLAFTLSPAAIGAGIYKWTDENGKVTYGSQRPEDIQAEKMQLRVPEPATKPEADKASEADAADMSDDDKAKKERVVYCANERKRLQTLSQNQEIHEKNDQGEVQKLSAEARNQRLEKIRANLSQYCQ
jgi:hypothetical protein